MRASLQLLTVVVVALLAPGCFLDRSAADAPGPDSGQPPDIDAAMADAFVPPEQDAGPTTFDAGPSCMSTGPDLCGGGDQDCDPGTLDGSGELGFDTPCDGEDADQCEEGMMRCAGDELVCDDMSDDNMEVCNGLDDNCDGNIDEGAGCSCHQENYEGRSYLFCDERVEWGIARTSCPTGYQLGRIDDRDEHEFVVETATAIRNDNWWFGGTDAMPISPDGQFRWLTGGDLIARTGGAGFSNWGGGQPDGSADCLEVGMNQNGVLGIRGRWNDAPCTDMQPYVCESLASSP